MKFAHLADCHLGSWKEPKLQELNLKAFDIAIESCISEKVDFVLITGDLFDSALPSIDILKEAAAELKKLKDHRIQCYVIAGSHDYSVSGKTFLDVLEKAGLCENVERLNGNSLDAIEKENFIIAGISGKKSELEKDVIRKISVPKMDSRKFKILALHTTIEENKTTEFVEGIKISELPKGFDYYALGHIHKPFEHKSNDSHVAYPGPLFPNNFAELEEISHGGFFIVNVDKNKTNIEREEIRLKDILSLEFSADGKNPFVLTSEIVNSLKKGKIDDKIVLMKINGTLKEGKTYEIDFDEIKKESERCFVMLRNISKLKSPETKIDVEIKAENIDEIENEIFKNIKTDDFKSIARQLFIAFDIEKLEGETLSTFEKRLMENIRRVIEI